MGVNTEREQGGTQNDNRAAEEDNEDIQAAGAEKNCSKCWWS